MYSLIVSMVQYIKFEMYCSSDFFEVMGLKITVYCSKHTFEFDSLNVITLLFVTCRQDQTMS